MSKQVLTGDKRSVRQSVEYNSDILPLAHSLGVSRKILSNVNPTSTLIELHNILSGFGLNKNEIKVYLFLSRYGVQKASKISEILKITRSETYKILRSLESQGVILRFVEKPFKYAAVPLKDLFDMFIEREYNQLKSVERKRDELLEKWNLINKRPFELDNSSMVLQVLEGTNHIFIKLKELLSNTANSFRMAVPSDILLWLYNTPFFELIEERNMLSSAPIDVCLITECSDTSDFVFSDTNTDVFDFKLVSELELPGFFISDDREIILLIRNGGEELYAIWTNYDALVASNLRLFSLLWDAPLPSIKTDTMLSPRA